MLLNLALSVLSAVLLILSYPRADAALLAPVALAPLVVALGREPRHGRRFLLGWASGIVYWAGTCYWIQDVLAVHGGMTVTLSWLAMALFAVAKGLHTAVFALLAGFLLRNAWAVVGVPALWVVIECTHGYLGFAWLTLGNAGINMSVPMRLAPWTGVWGLSFLFAMTATALALIALRRPRWQLAGVLALPLLYLLPSLPRPERGIETAALVQPNTSETAEWTPQWIDDVHKQLVALSLAAAAHHPVSLVVWPEIPAPMFYYTSVNYREEINNVARSTNAYLLLNVVPRDSHGAPLNSALLISPEGVPVGRYDKMNLVPFGEFVPWPFNSLVEKISSGAGDFAPGRHQVVLPAGHHRIGAFVCYESVFPDFVRKFATEGAELYVNISNDGWYGRSAARFQHLEIVRMRAAENRRWLLRATNDGITATIDPGGRARVNLPPYVAAATTTRYSWITATTFYSRHGNWFVWVCVAVALLAAYPWRITKTSPSRTT